MYHPSTLASGTSIPARASRFQQQSCCWTSGGRCSSSLRWRQVGRDIPQISNNILLKLFKGFFSNMKLWGQGCLLFQQTLRAGALSALSRDSAWCSMAQNSKFQSGQKMCSDMFWYVLCHVWAFYVSKFRVLDCFGLAIWCNLVCSWSWFGYVWHCLAHCQICSNWTCLSMSEPSVVLQRQAARISEVIVVDPCPYIMPVSLHPSQLNLWGIMGGTHPNVV